MLTVKTAAPNRRSPLSAFSLGLIGVPLLALGALAVPESASANAGRFATIYNFAGGSNDGCNGYGPLIIDGRGVLHGETYVGGTSNDGTVFSVQPETEQELSLYSFQGSNGTNPFGGLIYDIAGNLYGVAQQGGSSGNGTVFRLAPDGVQTILHNFAGGSSDGSFPDGQLVADSAGNLYGAAGQGGLYGHGTVFKLAPKGSTYTTLYNFTGGDDGADPSTDLVFDPAGNLYGTTAGGGASGNGTVFELTTSGQLLTKYSFQDSGDGAEPAAGLVFDRGGNLYGTTFEEDGFLSGLEYGNVFELAADGTFSVLYSFQGLGDGYGPEADLIFDSAGDLYGTTIGGGAYGGGTAFRLSPDGNGKLTSFEALASSPGVGFNFGLVLDKFGTLYGTSATGGTSNCGIVYAIYGAAAAGPTLTASPASLTFQPANFTSSGFGVSYQTVTISIQGGNYISKTPLLTGPNAYQFGIVSNSCTGIVASGGSCAIKLAYVRDVNQPANQNSTAFLNLTGDAALFITLTGEK